MAIGLTGRWKVPLCYVLTAGLSASKQARLLKDVIIKLHEIGVRTVAVVSDGLVANQSMYQQLGCNFEPYNMTTTFQHPVDAKPIYVFFDACHQLKLMRNAFATFKDICSPFLGKALWQHIVELNTIQQNEDLRAANKLTTLHVNYHSQKMKVYLAAQVFSTSVGNALAYLRSLKNDLFINSDGTEHFLKFINDLFDILNSKSPSQKGNKGPINNFNIADRMQFLQSAEEILLSLTIPPNISLYDTKRHLSCIGFVVNCISLRLMATELINEKLINYLLTYKLSQDHLELFFSAIRSAGGKNINPNGLQLRNILRTLLSHTDVVSGVGTNVVGQDNTTLLPINSKKLTHTANAKENNEININIDYSTSLSLYTEGIVEYIGGFVVKELLQTESCIICREALVSKEICFQEFPVLYPSLLNIKDLGGLHKPSKSVLIVLKCTETYLRAYIDIRCINSSNICTRAIDSKVLSTVTSSCFSEIDDHIKNTLAIAQNNINSHYTTLVKAIVACYLKVRIYHIASLTNQSITKNSIRMKLTKAILFANQ